MKKDCGDVSTAGNAFQKQQFVMEDTTVMFFLMKQVG